MAETFSELVQILSSQNKVSIVLDGNKKNILIGPYYDTGLVAPGTEMEGSVEPPIIISSQGDSIDNSDNESQGLPDTIEMVSKTKGISPMSFSLKLEYRIKIMGDSGDIFIRNKNGNEVLWFDAKHANLYAGGKDNGGDILIRDNHEKIRIHLDGSEGDIMVKDDNGKARIHLDGSEGDIKLTGADCAEEFYIENFLSVEPGAVMVIGTNDSLIECEKAYDKCVAGVLSGAGGFKPALILDKKDRDSESRFPLALSGKVFCKVDADYSPIETGDLLTTSPTKGHGMKAADSSKAFGAVIGKALKRLDKGKGLIPVLVSLQ